MKTRALISTKGVRWHKRNQQIARFLFFRSLINDLIRGAKELSRFAFSENDYAFLEAVNITLDLSAAAGGRLEVSGPTGAFVLRIYADLRKALVARTGDDALPELADAIDIGVQKLRGYEIEALRKKANVIPACASTSSR
jgi:hypothetical protein